VDTVYEAPGIPHTVVIETLETRSGFVQPRTRVYTYWDVDPDTPGTTLDELGRESEADATTSVFLEDSDVDQYLNEILDEIAEGENEWSEYEWGDSDTEYEAIPDSATSSIASSDAEDDGHVLSHFEVENEGESMNVAIADDTFISPGFIEKLARHHLRTSGTPPLVQRRAQSPSSFALQHHHRPWCHP
jgi:hypothetical protein